jgi:hypothetical protein
MPRPRDPALEPARRHVKRTARHYAFSVSAGFVVLAVAGAPLWALIGFVVFWSAFCLLPDAPRAVALWRLDHLKD